MGLIRVGRSVLNLAGLRAVRDNATVPGDEHPDSVTVFLEAGDRVTFYGGDAEAIRGLIATLPEAGHPADGLSVQGHAILPDDDPAVQRKQQD